MWSELPENNSKRVDIRAARRPPLQQHFRRHVWKGPRRALQYHRLVELTGPEPWTGCPISRRVAIRILKKFLQSSATNDRADSNSTQKGGQLVFEAGQLLLQPCFRGTLFAQQQPFP
jgi:hypothetical protein